MKSSAGRQKRDEFFGRLRSKLQSALKFLLSLPIIFGLTGCDMFGFHDFEWHQKLTVMVDTPSGPVTGSAVTEATVGLRPKWYGVGDSAGAGTNSLKGEAVVVEVAPGRYLFLLLKGYSAWTAGEAFFQPSKKLMNREQNVRAYGLLETLRESSPLPRDLYPLFVTFDDIADPASVKRVEPGDLKASFGPGYSLRSVTIAITDEPVTQGEVEKTNVRFLNKKTIDEALRSKTYNNNDLNFQLTRNDFISGR